MDDKEVRLRCIEAAAKAPMSHVKGYTAGVQEAAESWYEWINSQNAPEDIPVVGTEVLYEQAAPEAPTVGAEVLF